MIELVRSGSYKLSETKKHTKLFCLEGEVFAWVESNNNNQIQAIARKDHKTDCRLGAGRYFTYKAEDEPGLSDGIHLELEVGSGWQAYLLPGGLPHTAKKQSCIIPINETITGSQYIPDQNILKLELAQV